MNLTKSTIATIALLASTTTHADLDIRFIEGAPKDTFVINNTGACELSAFTVDIDLSSSAGKLIFDTTEVGAGVEVYQPFEVRSGELSLSGSQQVDDGNDKLSIKVARLSPKQSVSFTIDVDDRLRNSELGQIRVSDSEIQGAIARVSLNDTIALEGVFTSRSRSSITLPSCV